MRKVTPHILGSRLAQFYERAGHVVTLEKMEEGALSVIGAVSPAGGDISEPVTQATLRIVKVFWSLDAGSCLQETFPSGQLVDQLFPVRRHHGKMV